MMESASQVELRHTTWISGDAFQRIEGRVRIQSDLIRWLIVDIEECLYVSDSAVGRDVLEWQMSMRQCVENGVLNSLDKGEKTGVRLDDEAMW